MQLEVIKCHGSGNKFIMVDMVADSAMVGDMAAFARQMCSHPDVEGADGILYVVKVGDDYAMRMFNPDGSEAEMCGNGIRCVARLVQERYVAQREFTLRSGKGFYPITESESVAENVKAYGVDIEVRLTSPDFGFMAEGDVEHIGKPIASLGEECFTALNLGNPHIVAAVDEISMERLTQIGEQVLSLGEDFPRGINVSLYRKMEGNAIFVATYERGAGITYSCGTAMTASSTAATLLGLCREGEPIEVYNRGGKVRCLCRVADGRIVTRLMGNATYQWSAQVEWDGAQVVSLSRIHSYESEEQAYEAFLKTIQ